MRFRKSDVTITIGLGAWLREDRRDFIVILSERG